MRHTFDTSQQTLDAVGEHVKAIAEEMQVSDKAIYAMLASKDPYARFRPLFRATARTNSPGARVWLRDMIAIIERERRRGRHVEGDPVDDIDASYHRLTQVLRKGQSKDEQRTALKGLLDAVCAAMDGIDDGEMIERSPVLANKRTTAADDFR